MREQWINVVANSASRRELGDDRSSLQRLVGTSLLNRVVSIAPRL